jgi:hypothetical protein
MLLVSLYLPWRAAPCKLDDEYFGTGSAATCGFLNLFSGVGTVGGLSTEVGRAAALFGLLLAALASAVLIRPNLVRRLPLGRCALVAGYFALAVGVEARSDTQYQEGFDYQYAYGAYVGLAATIIILVAAVIVRRGELALYRSASALVLLVFVCGLLAAFLLPWAEVGFFTYRGIESPAAAVAAALALWLPSRIDAPPTERIVLAAAVALFTGGAAVSLSLFADDAYGPWPGLGIALAVALVVLSLVGGPPTLRPTQWSWRRLAAGAAAALFVAALFLPWQRWCYGAGSEFGPYAGRCIATNGWATIVGAAAALLAIALAVAILDPRRLPLPAVELAGGFGLLVVTLGFQVDEGGGGLRSERAYGSAIGFTLAAVLIALALARTRLPRVGTHRLLVLLAPIAPCAFYLAIVVLPWWDVLPVSAQSSLSFAPLSWLTIAGALLGIHLLGLWTRQLAGASAGAELVLLPLALLALAAVDLIAERGDGINWGGGAVVGLCLLLAVLGRIEQQGGLERFRVPEILRVDRL